MPIWDILDIEPTREIKEIKKAYLRQLKFNNPEDNPQGFIRLREAYEHAIEQVEASAASEPMLGELSPEISESPVDDVASIERVATARAYALFQQIRDHLEHFQLTELEALLERETQSIEFWHGLEVVNHLNIMLISYFANHPIPIEMAYCLNRYLEWATRIPLVRSRVDPQIFEGFSRRLSIGGKVYYLEKIDHFLEKFRKSQETQQFESCMHVLMSDISAFLDKSNCGSLLSARIYAWLGEADLEPESVMGLLKNLNLEEPELVELVLTQKQFQKTNQRIKAVQAQLTEAAMLKTYQGDQEDSNTGATKIMVLLASVFLISCLIYGLAILANRRYVPSDESVNMFKLLIERNDLPRLKFKLGDGDPDQPIPNTHNKLLWLATCYNRVEMVDFLLQAGASPDRLDQKTGRAALYQAITQNATALVLVLLKGKANPNQLTLDGSSPLQAAVDQKNREIVKMLIEHGVNLAQGDPIADQARASARSAGDDEMAALLDPKNQVIPPPL